MASEQLFIGGATAVLCLAGLRHDAWLLEHTSKGRRLVRRFGAHRATLIMRLLLAMGFVFGGLLAAGLVNPIRW